MEPRTTTDKAIRIGDWIGYAIGAIGIVIAVIAWQLSIAEREPTFLVHPERVQLVRAESVRDSSIRVTRADGSSIAGDVTALRFYFWNKGKVAINREDIYASDPLRVVLDGEVEILDKKIVAVSREKIIAPVLDVYVGLEPARTVNVSFNTLETGDGFAVQLIYSGPPDAKLYMKGSIRGVTNAGQLADTNMQVQRIVKWRQSAMVIVSVLNAVLVFYVFRKFDNSTRRRQLVALVLVFVWFGLFIWLGLTQPSPTEAATNEVPTSIR